MSHVSHSDPADSELLTRTPVDPEAFGAFYDRFEASVLAFFYRATRRADIAADLTAETFAAALAGARTFDPEVGSARSWLFGIARHVIAAEFRRSARERRAESLVAGRRLLGADDVDRLAEKIDAFRQARRLHEQLQALPDGERAVLELMSVDGLSVAEAAAALNIGQVAARVRLHRARRALRSTSAPPVGEKEVMS